MARPRCVSESLPPVNNARTTRTSAEARTAWPTTARSPSHRDRILVCMWVFRSVGVSQAPIDQRPPCTSILKTHFSALNHALIEGIPQLAAEPDGRILVQQALAA